MKHHPITFVAQCVPGVLDGSKTQTRRVVTGDNGCDHQGYAGRWALRDGLWWYNSVHGCADRGLRCPYGVPGDRLWVQEAYQIRDYDSLDSQREVSGIYLADGQEFRNIQLTHTEREKLCARKHPRRPSPGRFMYRSLSRLTLELADVRVERVQDIVSDEYKLDVFHEGICTICDHSGTKYSDDPMEPNEVCGGHGGIGCWVESGELFRELWDSINAKRGFDFASNPWVWALTFKKAEEKP